MFLNKVSYTKSFALVALLNDVSRRGVLFLHSQVKYSAMKETAHFDVTLKQMLTTCAVLVMLIQFGQQFSQMNVVNWKVTTFMDVVDCSLHATHVQLCIVFIQVFSAFTHGQISCGFLH